MQHLRALALHGAVITTLFAAAAPSFGAAPPSLTVHKGTFAQFTFANAANPFVVTENGGVFTSNTEKVSFDLFNGVSSTPISTVHALMSFSGIAGAGPDGNSNVQNINYNFFLDPAYYSGLNSTNNHLLTIGTVLQPDSALVNSNVQLTRGAHGESALSGETTAYDSDYFWFGNHNDTALNNWSASFTNVTYSPTTGSLGFSTPSGSGQFYAEEFALTNPVPTPEAGSMASLGLLMVPAGFMFFRRKRAQITTA